MGGLREKRMAGVLISSCLSAEDETVETIVTIAVRLSRPRQEAVVDRESGISSEPAKVDAGWVLLCNGPSSTIRPV